MSNKKRDLSKYLPVIRWLRCYTKKKCVSDIIAGVTVGVTMIPQSIAYAALANLTPQYGLNSAFVGCFVYAVFGTIKEVFIGPSSLMSILAATYTHNLSVEFIIFLTFLSGCMEFIMGILKLGFLVDFISVPVISGFVSAVAIIIFISQLKDLMGLKFKSGNMVQNIMNLISNCDQIKYYDFILGVLCIMALYSLRSLKDINFKNKKKKIVFKKLLWFISISRNAIVVFFCMCLSAWFQFKFEKVPFVLTAKIDSGVPELKMPPFSTQVGNVTYSFTDMVKEIGSGIFVVPLVAILENIAIAKAFSKGKTIEATQEMFALSFSNVLGACFGAMPTCGALTRSAVGNASNVQSPIASLYSGIVVLLAVTFLSPYFHFIPRATLAAVLICALLFLIEWEIVMPLWKSSKKDFFILIVTFFLSVIFGVEIGLLSGIAVSLFHLIYLWACPKITSEICSFTDGEKYILLSVDKGLYFPCMDRLRNIILLKQQELKGEISAVVLDCTYFTGIDYTAIKDLCLLITELNDDGQKLMLLNPNNELVELCHTIGNIKMLLHFTTKEEIEEYLCYKDKEKDREVKVCIPKDYLVSSSDVKTEKEILPFIDNTSLQSKAV